MEPGWGSPAGLVERIIPWKGRKTFFSKLCIYRTCLVKNEKYSWFNNNMICCYKMSTQCLRREGVGQTALGDLFVGGFTFSKLVFSLECHVIHEESNQEHMPGFSSSAADLSCQFVKWFIVWSFWRIIVSIPKNEKWFRMSRFLF